MGAWTSEIPVDDDHRHQDTHCVHDEGEQKIFSNQWKH